MNTYGRNLRLTTFGESHGKAMGGVLDGFPPGIRIDFDLIQQALDARRPGASALSTPRKESDRISVLSGFTPEGLSLGTPIGFVIPNENQQSSDYDALRDVYRPNHADYTYEAKYGLRDHRGGGRASARETVNWVAGGAFAMQLLTRAGIGVEARLASVCEETEPEGMRKAIERARDGGDSVGGVVEVCVSGVPAGVGEPMFDKLDGRLASAMMGINGVKGVEIGAGFSSSAMLGSEMADCFVAGESGCVATATNFSGGVQGGISNGMPITLRVAFKPTPSISKPLATLDREGSRTEVRTHGRHDPCIALRGVQVVKAMAALTVADLMLAGGYDFGRSEERTGNGTKGVK